MPENGTLNITKCMCKKYVDVISCKIGEKIWQNFELFEKCILVTGGRIDIKSLPT